MIAEKLRKAVLQAAIQGKLTEQLPEDGDARDLLKEIQQEKARLVKEGKLKKEKPLPEITEDEIPFDIPENWVWCRLDTVTELIMGQSPDGNSVGNEGMEFHQGKIAFGEKTIQNSNLYCSKPKKIAEANTVLLCVRAPVGKVNLTDRTLCIGRGLAAVKPLQIYLEYLYFYFLTIEGYFTSVSTGTTFKAIGKDTVKESPFPLPPLAEQQRIVDQVEILLPQLKTLEADESKLEALQKAFPHQLKNAILQAAIQGKLTEQLPEDGDARDLLKQIQQEKASLVKAGKLKKEKPLPPITEDELPFDIPESWIWVRLGEIVSVKGGKRIPLGKSLTKIKTNHKYIRVADMQKGTVLDTNIHYVPDDVYPMIEKYTITANDVYITVAGTIGRVGTIPNEFDLANLTENADKLVFNFLEKMWLVHLLDSSVGQNQIIDSTTKVGQPKLAIKRIEKFLIPLPPLAEQERIVERLEELLPLCEKLE